MPMRRLRRGAIATDKVSGKDFSMKRYKSGKLQILKKNKIFFYKKESSILMVPFYVLQESCKYAALESFYQFVPAVDKTEAECYIC